MPPFPCAYYENLVFKRKREGIGHFKSLQAVCTGDASSMDQNYINLEHVSQYRPNFWRMLELHATIAVSKVINRTVART